MNAALKNWKTTLAGLAVGILLAALTVYHAGMTWKEWLAAAGIAIIGALPGILAQDGITLPQGVTNQLGSFAKKAPVLLLVLLLGSACFAQTTPPAAPAPTIQTNSWTATGTAINLPGGLQTLAGTYTGIAMPITTNFSVTESNFITSDTSFTGFYGGASYRIPQFSKWLNDISPNLNGYDFNLRIAGGAGVNNVTIPSPAGSTAPASTKTHFSWTIHAPLTYAIAGSSTWNLLVDVGYLNAPGALHRNNAFIAAGPTLNLSNLLAALK